jgi:hypothetical protein
MLLLLAAGIFVVTFWMVFEGFTWIAFVLLVVLDAMLLLFSTLTVVIGDSMLEITFGPGMIRKRFELRDVCECREVRNPFWYGWGIHWTPHGWVYNVSGSRAVELCMRNGKRYRIGTDAPEELMGAIRRALGVFSSPPNVNQPHAF